jgi:hypothetical protein
MDWYQILALVGPTVTLFLWSRSESRADSRRVEYLVAAMNTEMKDFHGRLCSIEAQWKGVKLEKDKSQES